MLWLLELLLGAFLMSISVNMFLLPQRLAEGGVTGIAILLDHLIHLPTWVTTIVLNIPLVILGVRLRGRQMLFKTLLGIGAYAFFQWATTYLEPMKVNVVLAIVYGGLTMGIGLGLVLRSGGTTGGTDILAIVAQQKWGISVGTMVLLIDAFVLCIAGFVFGAEAAMWSAITLFISSKMVDLVQEGFYAAKGMTIISEKPDEIAQRIMTEVERGCTVLNGRGAWTGEAKGVLYVVLQRSEMTYVKEIIFKADPKAFVVVADVHEVLGEGFKPIAK
ncbi:MAG TPA: YitT family protein [Symbiobacteriaceae bacterium]|nr:YitT family protein [Symbiobacteriaceae bacterium]